MNPLNRDRTLDLLNRFDRNMAEKGCVGQNNYRLK